MINRVLVGGGTGFIGQHLVKVLEKNGCEVTIASRKPGIRRVTWDDISVNGLPPGTTSVVNLSGENVLNFAKRWNKSFKETLYQSRVYTTAILAKAINETCHKPKVFVSISGVGIYPPCDNSTYDEDSSVQDYDFLSRLCHDWEAAAKLTKANGCRSVKIRCGVVLGRNGGMINNLYLPFFFGLGGPIGNGKQCLPWIHIDDIVNLIHYSIKNNVTGIFNGVAPTKTTNKEFTEAFAKSLSRPAALPVPELLLNVLLGKERAAMMTKGQHVIPKRALEAGFHFKYPDIMSACHSFSYLFPKKD